MGIPKIFADFNNADEHGRVRLNTTGTFEDIQRMKINLEEGMQIFLDDYDSLIAIGRVKYSNEENVWVAEINWDDLK
jgi:hypothetical protein